MVITTSANSFMPTKENKSPIWIVINKLFQQMFVIPSEAKNGKQIVLDGQQTKVKPKNV